MSLSGSFNRNFPMQAQNKQAGVGLLLGEHRDSQIVAVKQVVPRGSADRAGRIRAGDQILKVGETEARGLGVNELRNYIIGDQGSTVRITFKREDSDEMYELDLIRGTPEYFDGMAGAPQQGHMQQMQGSQQMQGGQGQGQGGSLYASGNRMQNLNRYMLGTSWSAEMFAQMPPPQQQQMEYNPERALSEENEWLRNALRMAESTIMRSRTDLGSMRELFLQSKSESESRVKSMEETNRGKDDERREAEQALLNAEEYRRTLEVKLAEAQRRSEWQRDTERQIMDNERARVDYLNDIKRRAEEEKRMMEMELMRIQDDLRAERAARVEAEAREASLRSDFQRLTEHRGYDQGQPTITSSLEVIPRPGQEALLSQQGRTEIMMA
mmetsp:Transcript_40860/g.93162  ORF Transcript_40860/g.93162 Transcript_40860/m.93162 type:complete len:383 (+) Transcript_40860:89-1237(+)